MGRGNYVTSATAKVEIWRGLFFVSSQVKGACSCSEGRRQSLKDCGRHRGAGLDSEGREDFTATAKTDGLWRRAGPKDL